MCVRGASSACGTRSFQRVTRRCAGSPAVRASWPQAAHACAPCSLAPADIPCVLSSNVNSICAFQNLSNADSSNFKIFSQDLGPPSVAPLYLVPLFYFKKNAHTLFFLIPYPLCNINRTHCTSSFPPNKPQFKYYSTWNPFCWSPPGLTGSWLP